MYGRPVDDNERRYLNASWRVLRIANRMRLFSFFFACLCGLVIVGLAVFAGLRDGHRASGIGVAMFLGLVGVAIIAVYGFLARLGLAAAGNGLPDRPLVEDIEGPFRIQSTRARLLFWLGDRLVILPGHWLAPIERAGEQRIFRAEAVQAPTGEMMILTLGDRLSVSRDMALGLRTSGTLRLPLLALAALGAFLAGEVVVHVSGDSDLTLRRYFAVGRNPVHFASVAEFRKAMPPLYTPVDLGPVMLTCGSDDRVFAIDGAPDDWRTQGEALRARAAALAAKADAARGLSDGKDVESRSATLFIDAQNWVRRLEDDAVRRGLRLSGERDRIRPLRDALDIAAAFATADTASGETDDLRDRLRRFDAAVAAPAIALKSVPGVEGVVYPLGSDGVILATSKSYSPGMVLLEVIVDGIGLLTGGLMVAAVVAFRRRRPIRRRIMAALPDVA